MRTEPFSLIVFDWDGTLMDSVARISNSLAAAGAESGLSELSDECLKDVIGLGMREAVIKLYPALDESGIASFIDAYRHHFLAAPPAPLFDGVPQFLQALSLSSLCLAVATGKSRAGLDQALAETDCRHYFHATRTAEETCSKPDPQMLFELIEELGSSPANTLMVGDSRYDLAMAQRAGVASLAVSYGVHDVHRLAHYQPLACVDSITELQHWFQTNIFEF